ncbi:hypothetical protein GIX45_28105, partial [Erwinia sp. CPCC 100877]|nr:hypothetical protein [Erwinia sp. CPCC 100877]
MEKSMKKNLFLFTSCLLLVTPVLKVDAEETDSQSTTKSTTEITNYSEKESSETSLPENTATSTSDTNESTVTDSTEASSSNSEASDAYYEPAPSSRSDLNPYVGISPRSNVIDKVNAGESNRPKVSFIDVSSHNGTITVDQYKMMKTYGVTGVVVKLTEGTTYVNPYAQSQIKNAQAAGLKVSVYHYSFYTSTAGAKAEASYFASEANRLGLSKGTVMVSDIEETVMRTSAVNGNTAAFKNQLNSLGYSNVAYYLSRSWLDVDGGVFNTNMFGKNNIWVAQYPYSPTASQNWNSDYSSWQWSSNFYFPGISHPFDINTDYNGLFTGEKGWDDSISVTGTTTIADKDGSENIFKAAATVKAGGYTPYKVYFATWSDANGQDDLIWYEGVKQNDGSWVANIDISKHATSGKYIVHTYAQMTSDPSSKKITANSSFTISNATINTKVGSYNAETGTFDVIVSGVSKSGIKRVSVPVWSKEGQADLIWYEGVRQADGTYKVTVDIKNHSYNTGSYRVHSYLYSNNGVKASTVSTPVEVTTLPKLEGKTTIQDTNNKETKYSATVDLNMGVYGKPKDVYFATWSKTNGQDDIIWYKGVEQANGKYTSTIDITNHKTSGEYSVHTYVRLADGSMRCVATNTFTVSAPEITTEVGVYDSAKGTFDVTVSGISKSGIERVSIPVWSKEGQADLIWHEGI